MDSVPVVTQPNHRAIAPAWHTGVLLVLLLGFSFASARAGNVSPVGSHHGRVASYLVVMAFEWVMVAFIWFGMKRYGLGLRDLIGGSWMGLATVFRDLAIAVGFLLIALIMLNLLGSFLNAVPNQALYNLLPQSSIEVAVYLILTLTAGFCEETIFRGYLQRQFTALARAGAGGIVLQGIVFGMVHGYQGWRFVVLISFFGMLFGLLARWRRSLRPGMIAHFLQDGIGGLLARHFLR